MSPCFSLPLTHTFYLSVSLFHSISLAGVTHSKHCTDFLPREANFSHMFPTFIPSNGPICLSKCVCCVLFPARFVPMPSLRWARFLPGGVGAKASRYLYRRNSWGPPSQSGQGWLEKLSQELQVKPSVGNFSLFSLSLSTPLSFFFSISAVFLMSSVFLSWVSGSGQVRLRSL